MRHVPVVLLAAVALAAAASLENIPTDSRLYGDFDLLKTSGLIRSMPSTSRPWTRAEAARLAAEADSLAGLSRPGLPQRAALSRLLTEFGEDLPERNKGNGRRRPVANIAVPDMPGSFARLDLFSRLIADREQQHLSAGAVVNNHPGDNFAFYERFELAAWRPKIVEESIPPDSAGRHIPGTRVLPWRNIATLETEIAYLAFRIPWLRLELGRDKFAWGPGYTGSVMLSDVAPALDHVQLCASYRNFKFLSFTSLLSRWDTKPRFLSAQRIELSLLSRVTLGGALMDVTSWDSLQPTQLGGLLNPLVPVYLSEASSGHDGNFLVGWDAVAYLADIKVYGQLFLDNYEFNSLKLAPQATASQFGIFWAPDLPVDARLEYTRIMPFTYYHRVHSIMYENYLVPLGHPLGPDADQLYTSVGVTPTAWLKLDLAADYTRRGYHNRGDFRRMSYKNPQDTLFLRRHPEFPSLGWNTTPDPDTVIEEVDRTVRLSPGLEVRAFRDLYVSGSVSLWRSENYQGVIGLKKNGLDFAVKVEYRY